MTPVCQFYGMEPDADASAEKVRAKGKRKKAEASVLKRIGFPEYATLS